MQGRASRRSMTAWPARVQDYRARCRPPGTGSARMKSLYITISVHKYPRPPGRCSSVSRSGP